MTPPSASHPGMQLLWLFILAIPIACVAWTVTHEDVLKEPREFCIRKSRDCRRLLQRKFFYLFTCEYCLSHYVTLVFLCLTRFKLLLDDWRGYGLSLFALVFVANVYMSLYNRLRVVLNVDRTELQVKKLQVEQICQNGDPPRTDST
jgi:hypothetical protein